MTARVSCFAVLFSLAMCVEAGIAQDEPPSWHEVALTVALAKLAMPSLPASPP